MVARDVAGLAFAAGSVRTGLRFRVCELIQKVLLCIVCLTIVVKHRVQVFLVRVPALRPVAVICVRRRQ